MNTKKYKNVLEVYFEHFVTRILNFNILFVINSGKNEITKFKELHPNVTHAWNRIYSKINNEKKSRSQRAEKQLLLLT